MLRFEQKPAPAMYAAIAVSLAAIFVADIFTPLGTAVWVFYLISVKLSLYGWRPIVPVIVAVLATVLIVIAYFLSPPGVQAHIAILNRVIVVTTLWAATGIGYLFIRNKLVVRRQEWLQSGQTQLSDKMGGDQPLPALGENVLRFLSEYLDAHAGAFYVEDGGGFRRFATYAVPAQASLPERVEPGDGLLGQAVKDRRAFLARDVPEGYFTVGSSLGQSPPRHLLIAPAKVDGVVNAVLELGLIHPVYESDVELLNWVSESIGVAIRSAKYRTRQQELLEETRRQSEELQTQSEELRVSNEELAEQGRALKESQARLELQQSELEQTNTQLEEQTQLLEAQKDDLNRAKIALEKQARELEQASRYKSDFLANMSHELRTPLNSSLILAKLLADNREGNLTAEQVKYAQTIQSSGNDLLALINDILDLSKVEAGRVDVKPEPVLLSRLFENLSRTFQPLAAQKALDLRLEVAPGTPESVVTDPQRLEQVLKNLLSNALKFTEKGRVTVEASPGPDGRLALSVADTGIGIPAHQQEAIFEPFRQADGTTNRKYAGTGLGLSISRELVRLLGGELRLTSEVGHGSTFTVLVPEVYDMPLVPPPAADAVREPRLSEEPRIVKAAPPAAAQEAGRTAPKRPPVQRMEDDRERLTGDSRVILVVEDDEPFARIVYDLAHELGFQCLIATTAEEALAVAPQYLPSGVVLDIGLPDHSGLSVLDRLKGDSRTRHIPIHVVSVHDYTQTALSLGAVGYMLKPVKREQLVQAFQRLETKLTQKMRRVLIVEDDPVQLDSLRQLLGSREVETVAADSAAACLEVLRSTTVDCMVLDLNLPDASGFSLLQTLSREDRYSFPPVIVYTGRELTPDEEQQLRKYSKSIIIKGARSPERLLDEVTLFLHQVVSELPARQQKMIEKAHSRDAVLEGRRILLAEDDVRNIFALTSILEPRGVQVRITRNGREALEALEQTQQDPAGKVDLVLMDIMMPEMDGLTAIREIRQRPGCKQLPIIALTAKAMPSDHEQCLAAGANDYMAKPLDVEKLLSLIRVWMP
jgi:signal transduction histidine kinase/DNA-binding response OmpR family regulator